MSVYIKGMEMPKSCGQCLSIGWHYVFECRLDDVEEGERLPDCPLTPVPPHGRLIDADALGIRDAEKQAYEAYLREKGEFFIEEPLLEYMRGRLEGLTDACGRVRFAPTIIPADKEGE